MILYTHCKVNIKADDEVLKYRYLPDSTKPGFHIWFCNGQRTEFQVTELIKHLVEKYKKIEVTWKRQF